MRGADVVLSWALIPTHTSPLGKKCWRSHVRVVEKGSPKERGEQAKQRHNSFHIWLSNDKWPCHVHWLRAHYIILQQEIRSEKTLYCLKKSLDWTQHWNTALKAAFGSPAWVGSLDTLSQFGFLNVKAWNDFKMLQLWLCCKFWKSNSKQMGALVDRQPRELLRTGWGCWRWDGEHSGRMAAYCYICCDFHQQRDPLTGRSLVQGRANSVHLHGMAALGRLPSLNAFQQWSAGEGKCATLPCQQRHANLCYLHPLLQAASAERQHVCRVQLGIPGYCRGVRSWKKPLTGWDSCFPGLSRGYEDPQECLPHWL